MAAPFDSALLERFRAFAEEALVTIGPPRGDDALLLACREGDLAAARAKKAAGASLVRPRTARGATLLHAACYAGHAALAQLLIEEGGCQVNARDGHHELTPLHYAAASHAPSEELLDVLLYLGADPSVRAGPRQTTPSEVAAAGGRPAWAAALATWDEAYRQAVAASAWVEYRLALAHWWHRRPPGWRDPESDMHAGRVGKALGCEHHDSAARRAVVLWRLGGADAVRRCCLHCSFAESELRCARCRRAWFCSEGCRQQAADRHKETCRPWHPCARCGAPGRQLRCGRCKQAWFCDRSCQSAAWPEHKKTCTPAAAAPPPASPAADAETDDDA